MRLAIPTGRDAEPLLVAQKILNHVPHTPIVIGKHRFLCLDAMPPIPRSRLRGPGVIRRGTEEDIAGLCRVRNEPALFRERFASGDHCVVAEIGRGNAKADIVAYEWFCIARTHREGVWGYEIQIPPEYVYAYDAFIDPQFRNAGIWLRFKAYLAEWMASIGRSGVVTFAEHGNWASLGAHQRFGFKPGPTVFAVKMLGRVVAMRVDSSGSALPRIHT